MKFTKLLELDISNADVYLLEAVQDKLIINDAYNGIVILNDSLSSIADITLLDNLRIRWVFKKATEDEILLYCYENRCLIHISMHTFKNTLIPLPDDYKGQFLIPLYYWINNEIILASDNKLYRVDILNQVIKPIAETDIEESHLEFLKVWHQFRESDILFYDAQEYALIFQEGTKLVFEDFDLIRKRRVIKAFSEEQPIRDALYHKDEIVVVHDKELSLLQLSTDSCATLKAEIPYTFLKARFLSDSYKKFAVLCKDSARPKHARLQVYELPKHS
jgi:hypothetical protein